MAVGGFGGIGGAGAMFAPGTGAAPGTKDKNQNIQNVADAAKAKAEAAAQKQKTDLAAIRDKGIYAWAQEVKAEKIKEKIEQEIKAREGAGVKGPDESDPATWKKGDAGLEYEAVRQMREMLEAAMKSESERAAAEGEPAKAMIIDISV
ncbi:MAG: hypothetical protein AB1942_19330 [Pseudomonadota bacterium]